MRRLDNEEAERWWKIALYGPGGTGKTSMGVTAPKPLILLSERQGLPSIKQAAKRLGIPVPPVLFIETAEDLRDVVRALRRPRDQAFVVAASDGTVALELDYWPETCVVDSFSDAVGLLIEEMRREAPQQREEGDLPRDSGRFWPVLMERVERLIKTFRNLPMNVVFLCTLGEKTREDRRGNQIDTKEWPKVGAAASSQALCHAVNVMARTYRARQGKKVVFSAMTLSGHDGVLTKPCPPLKATEVADLGNWIARLNGLIEDDTEPPPPPESEEDVSDEKPEAADETAPAPEPEDAAEPEKPTGGEAIRCSECNKVEVDEEGEICEACEEKAMAG